MTDIIYGIINEVSTNDEGISNVQNKDLENVEKYYELNSAMTLGKRTLILSNENEHVGIMRDDDRHIRVKGKTGGTFEFIFPDSLAGPLSRNVRTSSKPYPGWYIKMTEEGGVEVGRLISEILQRMTQLERQLEEDLNNEDQLAELITRTSLAELSSGYGLLESADEQWTEVHGLAKILRTQL